MVSCSFMPGLKVQSCNMACSLRSHGVQRPKADPGIALLAVPACASHVSNTRGRSKLTTKELFSTLPRPFTSFTGLSIHSRWYDQDFESAGAFPLTCYCLLS